MKIQNCPMCGGEANTYNLDQGYARCDNLDCFLYNASCFVETWNRIRIAPDDKTVRHWDEDDHAKKGYIYDWMNPNYRKEQE